MSYPKHLQANFHLRTCFQTLSVTFLVSVTKYLTEAIKEMFVLICGSGGAQQHGEGGVGTQQQWKPSADGFSQGNGQKIEAGLDMELGCTPHAVPYSPKGQQLSKIEPQ